MPGAPRLGAELASLGEIVGATLVANAVAERNYVFNVKPRWDLSAASL